MGTQKPTNRLPGIQMARAVAALSVVYFHSWTILDRFPKGTAHPIPLLSKFGWVGVDLFFAISGYVICLVIAKPGFSPRDFLIKRVFRIYPLWLATLTTFAALAWLWRGLQPSETLGSFFYSATLLPTNGFPFYDIGWTLQHEMVFYALACIAIPATGIWGLVWLLIFSILSLHFLHLPPLAAHFAKYHGEFLAGVLAFVVLEERRPSPAMPLMVGLMSLCVFLTLSGDHTFLPISMFFFIIGFAGIQTVGTIGGGAAKLGDASYSLYLLHPLVFLIVKALTLHISTLTWTQEPIRFAGIAVAVAISFASWRLFERPMIDVGNRLATPPLKDPQNLIEDDGRLHDIVC